MTRRVCSAWVVLAALPAAPARAQLPSGGQFQVNSYTTSTQFYPSVAFDATGSFVVVWESLGPDGSGFGVQGQRFSPSGTPRGAEFDINVYTTNDQSRPVVAAAADGRFVVAWDTWGQDGSEYGIRHRRYDAQGAVLGGFAVNSETTGSQSRPAIAANPIGRFVIVWQDSEHDGSGYGIFGRIFDNLGAALGPSFQVNTNTTGDQMFPSVGMDTFGNFKVVYQSDGADGWGKGIVFQRFNWNGTLTGNFVVNSSTTGDQYYPSIAVRGDGSFVVVWTSNDHDGSLAGIVGRRFDASAVPLGADFQVNSYTTNGQYRPHVAMDAAGNFVVIWLSFGQDGSHHGVFGQAFLASGARRGAEFRVNSYTTGGQLVPAVAMASDGDFVVTWASDTDGHYYGIFARRYGDLLFENGFPSP